MISSEYSVENDEVDAPDSVDSLGRPLTPLSVPVLLTFLRKHPEVALVVIDTRQRAAKTLGFLTINNEQLSAQFDARNGTPRTCVIASHDNEGRFLLDAQSRRYLRETMVADRIIRKNESRPGDAMSAFVEGKERTQQQARARIIRILKSRNSSATILQGSDAVCFEFSGAQECNQQLALAGIDSFHYDLQRFGYGNHVAFFQGEKVVEILRESLDDRRKNTLKASDRKNYGPFGILIDGNKVYAINRSCAFKLRLTGDSPEESLIKRPTGRR